MSTKYLHRHIEIEANMVHGAHVNTSYSIDLKDDDNVLLKATDALGTAGEIFKACLTMIALPVAPEPGDEPLMQISIEYSSVSDDADIDTETFSVMQTETIEAGKGAEAVDNAISRAFKSFTRKACCFIQPD